MRLSEVRRKTVLIVTHGVDDHAPLVRTELADLGIEVCSVQHGQLSEY